MSQIVKCSLVKTTKFELSTSSWKECVSETNCETLPIGALVLN